MAYLPETATYEAGIYQLEITDPVIGGAGGKSNIQGNQLANRTSYLKQQVELKVDKDSNTGAALLPAGTSTQRPTASPGKLRFNTDLAKFEGYNGSAWGSLGGATGGADDTVFYTNSQTVTANYTIPVGQNAMTVGPITVNENVEIGISVGSVWIIF
jgi:hypothetical protein